jgi:histidinol-phosphate/aromatic aminotransferase/cobyric acid decarboxylase-like protein
MKFISLAGTVCVLGLLAFANADDSPQPQQYGHELLKLFALNSSYLNLNHGSFGAVPRVVTANMQKWDAATEECPDCFYRYNARPLLSDVLKSLANYVSADPADVVFIENASEGVNTIIRSMRVPRGKKLLYLNTAYGMVKNVMQ